MRVRTIGLAALFLATSFSSFADIVRTDNLVQNKGFFDGFDHWEIDYGGAVLGNNANGPYVYGKSTPDYSISQYIDLSSLNANLIDSGSVGFTAAHWQDSYIRKDSGYLRVAFFDDNMELISGVNGESRAPSNWTRYYFSDELPVGTRTIRLSFIAKRHAGSNLDAYFTNSAISLSAEDSDIALYGDFNGVMQDVPVLFTGALGLAMFGASRRVRHEI